MLMNSMLYIIKSFIMHYNYLTYKCWIFQHVHKRSAYALVKARHKRSAYGLVKARHKRSAYALVKARHKRSAYGLVKARHKPSAYALVKADIAIILTTRLNYL